ncbi:MAG: hypothetical protein KDC18_16295 [Alphaproteobacteria bacterium]|nr:hypothetical protein [Alphaproteobacteria bacterium]
MRVGGENNWGKNPVRVRDLRRKLLYLFTRHDQLKSESQKEGAMKGANLGRELVGRFFGEPLQIRSPSWHDSLDLVIKHRLVAQRRTDTEIDLEFYGGHLNNIVGSIRKYEHIKQRTSFIGSVAQIS